MPRIDPATAPLRQGTGYPRPYNEPCESRHWRQIGAAGGLEDFGANLVTVPPGAWSSQRHAHDADDELLIMVSGELVLIEEEGRTPMRAGDIAAFPKATSGGHHLVNESGADAVFLVVGANKGGASYPDIDLKHVRGDPGYRHADGTPYDREDYDPSALNR